MESVSPEEPPRGTVAGGHVATYWDRVAESRWGSYLSAIEKAAILRAHSLIRTPTTSLDVGCDGGRWSKLLSNLGWVVICTDVNQDVLDVCQQRIASATCILVSPSTTTLPCATDSAGLVLCIEVGRVMGTGWFIDEAHRVLQPGGVMVGVLYNRLSWRGLMKHKDRDFYRQTYHGLKNRLRRKGFTVIHEEGFAWAPFRRDSNSVLVPLFTSFERYSGLRNLVTISPWVVFIAQRE